MFILFTHAGMHIHTPFGTATKVLIDFHCALVSILPCEINLSYSKVYVHGCHVKVHCCDRSGEQFVRMACMNSHATNGIIKS